MAKRSAAAASRPQRIVGEPDGVVEDDYRPAASPAQRCAVCGMAAGLSPAGEQLGALLEHPLDASVPERERRWVHAGCAPAALVQRSGTDPLTASSAPPLGIVHVFERGPSQPDLLGRTQRNHKLRARCGFETALEGHRVEWSVYVAGHPSCCPGCAAARDPRAPALAARFARSA